MPAAGAFCYAAMAMNLTKAPLSAKGQVNEIESGE
jgi:hypothetical protein